VLSAVTLAAIGAGGCGRPPQPAVEIPEMTVAAAAGTAPADPVDPSAVPLERADVFGPGTPGDPITTATPEPAQPTPDGTGIPAVVLAAYRAAAGTLAATEPSCHLPWTLLAGIGKVESGHAEGGRVGGDGTTEDKIVGPPLDGGPGVAAVPDTDGGVLDGDVVWDRAVGPMQLVPRSWKVYAVDGSGDGVASPHNVFDAALAAGAYLCAGGGDLSRPAVQRAALMRYNPSADYGTTVLGWAAGYVAGDDVPRPVPGSAPQPQPQVPVPPAVQPSPAARQPAPAPAPGALPPAAPVVIAPVPAPLGAAPVPATPEPAPVVTAVKPVPARPVVTSPPPSGQPDRPTPAPVRTAAPPTPTPTPTPTPAPTPTTAAAIVTVASAAAGGVGTTAAPIVTGTAGR
jgi:membrane-bound lytic murein transglycosylase B